MSLLRKFGAAQSRADRSVGEGPRMRVLASTTTIPQQHKQFSLTLLAEGTGCGTYDPD